ncbi:MAG: GNAT family N-acetyltransferase [Pseudomonadota bacterium]
MTTIETDRLILRPFAPSDEATYAAIRSQPETARFLPGGVEGAAKGAETAARLVPYFAALWDDPGYGPWAVEEQATGRLIGHLGLRLLPEFEGETELLYALDPAAQGRGYAVEGARAALDYGFGTLRLQRIVAFALPENAPSLKVMERVGMTRRAELAEAFGMQVAMAVIERVEP